MKYVFFAAMLAFTLLTSAVVCSATAPTFDGANPRMSVKYSYTFDVCHFLNILSGDEKFVSYHRPEYKEWNSKLSAQAKGTLQAIIQGRGTTVFSSVLTLAISALPDFENRDIMAILADPTNLVDTIYKEIPESDQTPREQIYRMLGGLSMVVSELEAKGFRKYWETKKLPIIRKAIDKYNAYLKSVDVDMSKEVDFLLGPIEDDTLKSRQATVYFLAFAEPYGTGLFRRNYSVPTTWDDSFVTRTALHEMLHMPGKQWVYGKGFDLLMSDPFFTKAFSNHMKVNKVDYQSERGFMEENLVEALEVATSTRLGLCKDPVDYIRNHDGGDHWMAAVLIKYFLDIQKESSETLADYLMRVVTAMPLGSLDDVYADYMMVGK